MGRINQAQVEIEHSSREATKAIANAAGEAVKAIARAAEEAAKVVANTAATTAKVVDTKTSGDHDLLIKVEVKLDALKDDIQKLSDGTAVRISNLEMVKLDAKDSYPFLYKDKVEERLADHESRIRINTERIIKIMTWGSAGIIIIGIIEFIISNFYR